MPKGYGAERSVEFGATFGWTDLSLVAAIGAGRERETELDVLSFPPRDSVHVDRSRDLSGEQARTRVRLGRCSHDASFFSDLE